jgi:peptide deformylase
MQLPLRYLGDPVLRARAAVVESVTEETRKLIGDMFDTMYAEDGVGLAAPQVGIAQRIIVVDPRDDGVPPFALINPSLAEQSADVERGEEGCLSLPGLKEIVERPARVTVIGTGRDGEPVSIQAEGLLARILQHEIDHVDGILFIDRVSPLKRKMLLKRWEKIQS